MTACVKYSQDGPFTDPVVRCDKCQTILRKDKLKELGKCLHCGSIRVRNLQSFNEEERDKMAEWGIDPQFLALFEAHDE